ncbi:hypothetical protein SHI21_18055 [Bacteriovorax sp. PP10]|uniref:Uncharacterized protein n=1 Tax=Bacteriovorax antarcticus TaxID=3088717 RepID=A0ABU5VYK3_9BACT|nr:hypothetical protein [Bacteriovorax sp. PP10]MEA9358143.1 hypothetical protein [Bacteriovorax sp. PP10]
MNKIVLTAALLTITHMAFAFDATSETMASISEEIFFTTAITSVGSEATSFSTSDVQKIEARKILNEIQEYNQTGSITVLVAEKIAIIQSKDNSLSIDESVDVLIKTAEIILAK